MPILAPQRHGDGDHEIRTHPLEPPYVAHPGSQYSVMRHDDQRLPVLLREEVYELRRDAHAPDEDGAAVLEAPDGDVVDRVRHLGRGRVIVSRHRQLGHEGEGLAEEEQRGAQAIHVRAAVRALPELLDLREAPVFFLCVFGGWHAVLGPPGPVGDGAHVAAEYVGYSRD